MRTSSLIPTACPVFLLISSVFAILCFSLACDSPEVEDVVIDVPNMDPQVVLPPDYPTNMHGSTLVIEGYDGVPKVHSYPAYAGVSSPSEIGIGSAAGYDKGDSFTLPINANLGDKKLKSYEFLLIIDKPQLLELKRVSGNNSDLAKEYPLQYDRANGFGSAPTVLTGSTAGYIYISATATQTATGTINLAELTFKLLKKVPDSGINLQFQIIQLLDDLDADLCAQFSAGCHPKNGIIARNFRID